MTPFFRFLLLIAVSFMLPNVLFSQQKFTLSGTITEAQSGESVVGAKISIAILNLGTTSNEYGFYSLTVPKGIYEVQFKAYGLKTITKQIDLNANQMFNFEMSDETEVLDEVEVNAKRGENVTSTKVGQMELEMEKIKTLPAFMGEVDIIKTIQLLPGVSSVSEGGQGFYVRGGGPDQNLVYWTKRKFTMLRIYLGFSPYLIRMLSKVST
jgi:hypothetical protein